jgi:hypothetical protein
MNELVLSTPFYTLDPLLAQSSRSRVGKLALERRVNGLCIGYRSTFDSCAQPLHRFFNFWQLRHFSLDSPQKTLARRTRSSSLLCARPE